MPTWMSASAGSAIRVSAFVAGAVALALGGAPWVFSLAVIVGGSACPLEAGGEGGPLGSSVKKKELIEILWTAEAAAAVFLVVYATEPRTGAELWSLVALLALGGLLPYAAEESTRGLWVLLATLYASGWGAAGYYGPPTLWAPAFGAVVVCGGVRPALACYYQGNGSI